MTWVMSPRDLVPYLALAGQIFIFFRVEHLQIQEPEQEPPRKLSYVWPGCVIKTKICGVNFVKYVHQLALQ